MFKDILKKRKIAAVGLALFVIGGTVTAQNAQTGPPDADLKSLLEKTAEYCRKLEASVLDFFCQEDVRETIDYTRELRSAVISSYNDGKIQDTSMAAFARLRTRKYQYRYDYQCVRSGGLLKEKRIRLELKSKGRDDPYATPKTNAVTYENPFLCPAVLFAKSNQDKYDFKIAGTDRIDGRNVHVVEALLKEDGPGADSVFLSGKAWIVPETAEILRIELTQKRADRDTIFAEREKKTGGDLRLTTRAEFRIEKNGFLFPCTLAIEEGYLLGDSRIFKRSDTQIEFSEFRFFTVDVDTRFH